jgi:hypothetical protein
MIIVNPLLSRRVAKALKPQNHVLVALKDRQGGGAGRHCKPRGAIRRAENMEHGHPRRAGRVERR